MGAVPGADLRRAGPNAAPPGGLSRFYSIWLVLRERLPARSRTSTNSCASARQSQREKTNPAFYSADIIFRNDRPTNTNRPPPEFNMSGDKKHGVCTAEAPTLTEQV